jgi:hypothetical protein
VVHLVPTVGASWPGLDLSDRMAFAASVTNSARTARLIRSRRSIYRQIAFSSGRDSFVFAACWPVLLDRPSRRYRSRPRGTLNSQATVDTFASGFSWIYRTAS